MRGTEEKREYVRKSSNFRHISENYNLTVVQALRLLQY